MHAGDVERQGFGDARLRFPASTAPELVAGLLPFTRPKDAGCSFLEKEGCVADEMRPSRRRGGTPSAFARRTSSAGRLHRRNGRSHRLRAERRRAMRARFGGAEPASAEKAPTSSPGHSRRSRGCEQQNRSADSAAARHYYSRASRESAASSWRAARHSRASRDSQRRLACSALELRRTLRATGVRLQTFNVEDCAQSRSLNQI